MAEKLTLRSQSPYYDDFDATKNFLEVLYRPSFPVQARELTTSQSILIEQIKRFADFHFKDGTRVNGATLTVNNESKRLEVTGSTSETFPVSGAAANAIFATIGDFENLIISNEDGTVKAEVVSGINTDSTETVGDVYINYITVDTFSDTGDYFYAKPEDNSGLTQTIFNTFESVSDACLANVEEGVYYVKGVFSLVPKQTIVLSTTSSNVTTDIGLVAQESIITQNDDSTLFDNARGTTNEGAPGAHRLTINMQLVSGTSVGSNYYRVASIVNGVVQEAVEIDDKLNVLADVLAERTYDESGDYTVTNPTSIVINGNEEENFIIRTEPFKAYVRGYQVSKPAPLRTTISKGMENQKTSKNVSVNILGSSYYELSNVTGTLPGQGSNASPYEYNHRLLMKDGSGNTIGLCRGYAVNDEIEKGILKTKLYIYDVKMFQAITTTGFALNSIVDGNDVYSGSTRGYVYNADGDAGVAGGIVVISANNKFKAGHSITSSVLGSSDTIASVTSFAPSDVATIEDSTASFVATVSGTIQNSGAELIYGFNDRHIKTMKDGSASIMDNNFDIIEYTGSSATAINSANGLWDKTTVNDQEEIQKELKFAYVRICGNDSDLISHSPNYGWFARHKEITLLYPDVYRVYGINEATSGSFDAGRFTRLNVSTVSSIPQGVLLTGETSGNECIVVLQNTSNKYTQTLSNTSGFHETETGTGSSNVIEVIFTKGNSFTEGESLTARPIQETNQTYSSTTYDFSDVNYNYTITFNAVEAEPTGSSVNKSFQLDNGQRNEMYDVGRLVRKDNTPEPQNDLVVFYSYFESTTANTNHYYSADSYALIDFFDYDVRFENKFTEIVSRKINIGRDLRNVLDFRLRLKDINYDINDSSFLFTNRSFYNQSRILPNSRFTTDLTEFLGRVDTFYLDKNGDFLVKSGKPSINPEAAEKETYAMKLFEALIPPAVRYPSEEVILEAVDNKRFTMRDIGKLEKRIERVEEVVALTMLESQALQDDVGGRTKTGFVVDDFSTYTDFASTPADFDHNEWNASFDLLSKKLIPAQTSGTVVDMEVSSTTNISTFFDNYYIPEFTESVMVSQTNATSGYAINPFAVWTYYGDVEITPSIDTWFVRKENYFTNESGTLESFVGSEDEWENFLNITTASPGGASLTQTNWQTGFKTTASAAGRLWGRFNKDQIGLSDHREVAGKWTVGDGKGRYYRTGVRTTTTTFDQPRAIDGSSPVETFAGTYLIPNIQDYKMRALTVEYKATGLSPNAEHEAYFAGDKIISSLTTNNLGEASGSFKIPPGKYNAGTEEFKISDVTTGTSSRASANFTSNGMIQEFNLVQDVTRKGGSTSEKVVEFKEPIAQLFTLPMENYNGKVERYSSILTSIDLWMNFVDVRPTNDNITVEIRETVNGYPGGPDKIIGTTGPVTLTSSNEVTIPSSANATNFKFKQPVKLESNKEYAIVVLSPSSLMKTWVAKMGEVLADGSGIHSSQPNVGGYYGSFFVSQNGSTWNAEQNIDLTFNLYRAEFNTSTEASLIYDNTVQDTKMFKGDIGVYNQGLSIETYENSNYVTVFHPNHGLNFLNAQANLTVPVGDYNGLTDSDFNGVHDVYFATLDTYTIKTPSKATKSGKVYMDPYNTFSGQCVVYDGILTNIKSIKDKDDSVKLEIKTATTNSVKLEAASDKVSNPLLAIPVVSTTYTEVPLVTRVEFDEPQIVRNKTNITTNDLSMKIILGSSNPYSAPFWRKDLSQAPALYRNVTGYVLDDSDMENLTVTSVELGDTDDDNQKLASYYAGRNSIIENSAYVTKQIELEVPADGLTIFFDAQMFTENEIDIYYKARAVGDDTPYDSISWVPFDKSQMVNETNYGKFSDDAGFKNFEARTSTSFDFSSFKVKFVLKSPNEALVPSMRSLRIVADI